MTQVGIAKGREFSSVKILNTTSFFQVWASGSQGIRAGVIEATVYVGRNSVSVLGKHEISAFAVMG